MKDINPTINQRLTEHPEEITINHLNNFETNFSQSEIFNMYMQFKDRKLNEQNDMNSNLRKKQTYGQFIKNIHTLTREKGYDPNSKLTNKELLEILKYVLKNSDYTYYDLVQ